MQPMLYIQDGTMYHNNIISLTINQRDIYIANMIVCSYRLYYCNRLLLHGTSTNCHSVSVPLYTVFTLPSL